MENATRNSPRTRFACAVPLGHSSGVARSRFDLWQPWAVTVSAFLLLNTGAGYAAPLTATHGQWAKGHILVMPRAGLPAAEFDKILAPHGGHSLGKLGNLNIHVIQVPANAAEDVIANRLSRHPHIKFAEPDRIVAPDLYANDQYYGSAWHLQMVQAPAAWDVSLGNGVTVAILDTGVNGSHPDLQPQLVPGWNFWDNNSNTADVYGHGTLVAGVVAAAGNNSTGVTSLAWNAKLMPIRISDVNGYGSWSAVASGLNWAADHGAKVANISYMVHGSSTIQAAAQYMNSKGGVVMTSAGNTGVFDATPASASLISVSATDSADMRTGWSTYGAYVDLSAPGVGIWSTDAGGGYSAVSGTSFSSPLTAGVAALMLAANPSLSAADVASILKSTSVDRGTPGYDQYYGYGRVNAAAAVQTASTFQRADTQFPVVAITSPTTGGTVSGLVAIDVSAADNVAVTRVDLSVNGTVVASETAAPYQFSWDSTQASGTALLVARAFDAAGNSAASKEVIVSLAPTTVTPPVAPPADTIPPTVSITSPTNGSRVKGQVTIRAVSSDNVAVSNMTIFLDGVAISSGNTGSGTYRWNATKATSGVHVISAVAKDAAGNQSTATITVQR